MASQRFSSFAKPQMSPTITGKLLIEPALVADLLGRFVRILAFVLVFQLLVGIPLLASNKPAATVVCLISLASLVLAPAVLLRQGRVREAAICTAVCGFMISTILMLLSGGIRSPALILQVAMVVNTALILGKRWGYSIAGASLTADLTVTLFQLMGKEPIIIFPMAAPGVVIVVIVAFVAGLPVAIFNADWLHRLLADRQRLVDSVKGVVWEADPDTHQFLFVSRQAEALLGYPVKDWIADPRFWVEHLHPEDRDSALDGCNVVMAGGLGRTIEYRMIASDGRVVWLRDTITAIYDRGRVTGLCGILVDNTEQKEAEEARRISEERLKMAQTAAHIGLFEFDLRLGKGVFSRECYSLWGIPPDLAPSKDELEARIFPEDRERIVRSVFAAEESGSIDQEFRVVWPDGSIHWLHTKGELMPDSVEAPVRAVGVCYDITDRKQAQQALEESQQRFRIMADSAPVLIWMSEPDNSRSFFNEGWLTFRGTRVDQETGRGWLEGVHPGDRERCWDTYSKSFVRREPFEVEFRLLRHDGEYRWILDRGVPRKSSGGAFAGYIGSCLDITERKRTDRALRESQALLAESQEIAHVGGWNLDLATNTLTWTDEVYRIFGLRPQEFGATYEAFLEAVHPEDQAAVDQAYTSALRDSKDSYEIEHRLVRKEKSEIRYVHERCWLRRDAAGNVVRSVGTVQDITERKLAERERELLMSAIEQAGESILITDAEAAIQYVNPAFERITGYAREEVLGKNPSMLKSNMHDDGFYREMWATLARGETWRGQIVNRRKDGGLFTEEATISPVRDDSGGIVSYVGVKRDVTEQIELEEKLRQVQKLESVGRLAGGVAHDFNNLLTEINGYGDLLLARMKPEDPSRAYLMQIRKAGNRAAELTRQLLAFGRRQVVQPKLVNLNQLALDSLQILGRVAGENIEIVIDVDPDLGMTMVDPGQLQQALMNLVAHAREAMPDGGHLGIRTMQQHLNEGEAALTADATPGSWVVLEISDNGAGMSEETRQRIFEPFYTSKAEVGGTGLGLAMVYGVVRQAQGWITVESRLGMGTTFRIGLPVVEADGLGPLADMPQAGRRQR